MFDCVRPYRHRCKHERHREDPIYFTPHILPDLPTTLLWTEDPTQSHPLLKPLTQLANRVIFDSESSNNLFEFAQTVEKLKAAGNFDVADLNWARTEEWRNLIASIFQSSERKKELEKLTNVHIVYNQRVTEHFCHLKIQSMYLLAWLSNRLGWECKKSTKELHFKFSSENGNIYATIQTEIWKNLGPGSVISLRLETSDQTTYSSQRIPNQPHYVNIEITCHDKCELPYQFLLGQTATGHSLVQEICRKGTSSHYLEMLKTLEIIDKDKLC